MPARSRRRTLPGDACRRQSVTAGSRWGHAAIAAWRQLNLPATSPWTCPLSLQHPPRCQRAGCTHPNRRSRCRGPGTLTRCLRHNGCAAGCSSRRCAPDCRPRPAHRSAMTKTHLMPMASTCSCARPTPWTHRAVWWALTVHLPPGQHGRQAACTARTSSTCRRCSRCMRTWWSWGVLAWIRRFGKGV